MQESSDYNWHGKAVSTKKWQAPRLAVRCDEPVRPDQKNNTLAHEYLDEESVLEEKVEVLADMMRGGKCVVYSGAGLSRASGIPDYGSKAKESLSNTTKKLVTPLDAEPTLSHCVIARLVEKGLVVQVVNQNHDGLAQKAGVPEALVNEIHGAWFDPSNAVVQFNQNLRGDLFERLLETEKEAEMVMCVGTSLSGMNADRVVHSCAKRFVKRGLGRGSVVVNLQKTPSVDENVSLRIWATADAVFAKLAAKLDLPTERIALGAPVFSTLVPYNQDGERDSSRLMVLDVRPGRSVIVGSANDPNPNNYRQGMVLEELFQERHPLLVLQGKPGKLARQSAVGNWWISDAARGAVHKLCIRNLPAQFVNFDDTLVSVVQEARKEGEEHWNWEIDVLPRDDVLPVASVTFQLHPTFRPSSVTVERAPFRVNRTGWGQFQVGVRIVFVDYSTVDVAVELDFGSPKSTIQVPVKARRV